MGFTDLIERKNFVHVRTNPTLLDSIHQRPYPDSHFLGFVPQVTKIQSKDSSVFVEQTEWMKEGRLDRNF